MILLSVGICVVSAIAVLKIKRELEVFVNKVAFADKFHQLLVNMPVNQYSDNRLKCLRAIPDCAKLMVGWQEGFHNSLQVKYKYYKKMYEIAMSATLHCTDEYSMWFIHFHFDADNEETDKSYNEGMIRLWHNLMKNCDDHAFIMYVMHERYYKPIEMKGGIDNYDEHKNTISNNGENW